MFNNIDWFNEAHEIPGFTGTFTTDEITTEIRKKKYYSSGKRYLVVTSSEAFTINPEGSD